MKQRITRRLAGCLIAVVILGMLFLGDLKPHTLDALGASSAQPGSILDDVQSRGILNCGVNAGLPGFGALNAATGQFEGFDVEFCKAIAVAILGDPNAIDYIAIRSQERFTALQNREIDVLIRNTTWTFGRDIDLGADYTVITFYDGQGFIAPFSENIREFSDFNGKIICVQNGTTTQHNLNQELENRNVAPADILAISFTADAIETYQAGGCDVFTSDVSHLMLIRDSLDNPDAHFILPELISKEPLGPLVSDEDTRWKDLVTWVVNCTIAAEEFGISSIDLNPTIRKDETDRILGIDSDLGSLLGLDSSWCARVIEEIGNYGEIYNEHLDARGIWRRDTLNELWLNGGLLYSPPFR